MLNPLPTDGFETGRTLTPRVDRYARVMVRQATYSVPARFIGQRLWVLLRADEVLVFDRRREVARHERSTVKGSTTVVLDHYLEILARKPGALPGAVALDQARRSGAFAAEHEAFWAAARTVLGDGAGTRQLVEVLLLHRYLPREVVLAGLRAATAVGATSADVVAVEARRIADVQPEPAVVEQAPAPAAERVVSLTERWLADPDATIAALPRTGARCPWSAPTTTSCRGADQPPRPGRTAVERRCVMPQNQPRRRRRNMTEQAATA